MYRIYISQWYVLCGVINGLLIFLRSTRCKEYSSLYIPPNLNKISVRGNIL
jgi:hypothetical protein